MPALLLGFALLDYFLYPAWGSRGPDPSNQQINGAWIHYSFYFGERPKDEIDDLARRLEQARIQDAYFHVRYIKADGTLKFRYAESARSLNRRLSDQAPGIRRFAWVFAGHGKMGDVDLSDDRIRAQMVSEAEWLIDECGFEGIQWDYEPAIDGSEPFLSLLDETRASLPEGTPISVAAPPWFPALSVGWKEPYIRQVASRVDQIAVMTYDTGFSHPRAFSWLAAEQARRWPTWCKSANPDCEVLIGLPTYTEGFASHNPHAENITIGLWGLRKGSAAKTKPDGAAIFAEYTMDEAEWTAWRELWAWDGPMPPGRNQRR